MSIYPLPHFLWFISNVRCSILFIHDVYVDWNVPCINYGPICYYGRLWVFLVVCSLASGENEEEDDDDEEEEEEEEKDERKNRKEKERKKKRRKKEKCFVLKIYGILWNILRMF